MADCFYVNLKDDLKTTPISTGAHMAIVQQFDGGSAVSAAVYILVTTEPHHPLSAQSPGGTTAPWGTIHPDYISLEAAGAPSDVTADCAPALKNLLTYWTAIGRMKVNLWERDYILNSISDPSLLGLTVPSKSGLAIIGRGQSVSRLLVPYPTNTDGALAIEFPDTTPQFLFRDFGVLATGASGQAVSCGTAIAMTVSSRGAGATKQHGGIVERLHIGPDVDAEGNGLACFTTALNFTGTARPLVSATTICGCLGSTTGTDFTDTSPRYAAGTHIILDDCYSPDLEDVRLWNATLGVSYDCPTTEAQGFAASGCTMIGLRTAMYIRHKVKPNPNGILANNVIQFRDIGMDVGNIDTWLFPGNSFYLEGDIPRATPAYDMRFVASSNVSITGAGFGTFCGAGESQNCGYRVNIRIDAEIDSYGVSRGDKFLIDTAMFGDQSAYFALSAIQTTPSATNIHIGASNAYHGNFSGAVVDDASGTAITLVGYPGGAVAPNGAAQLGGGNGTPWPATSNYLNYLPPSGLPATPALGWVFFVDTDGKLKALSSTGNVVILGSP